MDSDTTYTGKRTLRHIITQRFPLILAAFVLAAAYIYIGYAMQEMKQHEDRLKNEYVDLRGTEVVTHMNMLKATDMASLQALIKKYGLNIITEKITPIKVTRDENSR